MTDIRNYPQGHLAQLSRSINEVLIDFGVAKTLRVRTTLAQINAGVMLLPALPGVKWQLLNWMMICLGGNATTATSVNIVGTSGGAAVQLAVTAIAALTRSAVVSAGNPNATILADGASFAPMDVNTAITAAVVGAAMTVATGIDLFIDYAATQG